MASVSKLYRLVWGGRLFDKEGWSCSLHVGSDAGLNLAASNFVAALTTWMGASGSGNSAQAKLDFIKFNDINPLTGRYLLPTSNELMQNDLATGASTASHGQLSLCVSTRTAVARGRGHAGRFYPPSGMMTFASATGLVVAGTPEGSAATAAALIRSINATVGVGSRVVVFSKIAQTVTPVTGVSVGHVCDTIRSRRASLLEDYVLVAL